MTWDEVAAEIRGMNDERRKGNATVRIGSTEFTGIIEIGRSGKGDPADGILDHEQCYLDVFGGGK